MDRELARKEAYRHVTISDKERRKENTEGIQWTCPFFSMLTKLRGVEKKMSIFFSERFLFHVEDSCGPVWVSVQCVASFLLSINAPKPLQCCDNQWFDTLIATHSRRRYLHTQSLITPAICKRTIGQAMLHSGSPSHCLFIHFVCFLYSHFTFLFLVAGFSMKYKMSV